MVVKDQITALRIQFALITSELSLICFHNTTRLLVAPLKDQYNFTWFQFCG